MKLKDISIFFAPKSSCCNGGVPTIEDLGSCQTPAKIATAHRYFKHAKSFNTPYAATITIGVKWLGQLSASEQYEVFVKRIKKHLNSVTEGKYVYHFELTEAGVLHAHGIELFSSQAKFISSFGSFGSRNKHNDAYETVKNINKYIEYCNKDNVFLPITNVTKKDLHELIRHNEFMLNKAKLSTAKLCPREKEKSQDKSQRDLGGAIPPPHAFGQNLDF